MTTLIKKNHLAALIIAASTFVLAFSSCGGSSKSKQSDEARTDSENVLTGTTWLAETDYANYAITFTESTYEWKDVDSGELMDSGDYSVDGSLVYLVRESGDFTDTYTLNGDELSIGANEDYKLFKKQN